MLDFRDLSEHCVPTGPSFSKAEDISISASGNIISFKAPKHKPSLQLYTQTKPRDIDITSLENFNDIPNSPKEKDQKYLSAFGRNWAFKGPIFTGYVAEIYFTFNIYKSLINKNEGQSLFNSKNFEKLILDSLTNEFDEEIDEDEYYAEWIAPINWKVNSNIGSPSIIHDILPHEECPHAHEKRLYAVLSNDSYLVMHSSMHQSIPGSIKEKDLLISRESMIQLTDQIFSSVSIELSDSSLSQLNDAQKSSAFKPFSKHVNPLKWTTDEQDKMHEESKKEIAYFKTLAAKNS